MVTYPDRLLAWAESEFIKLKARQAKLLGIRPEGNGNGNSSPLLAIASKL